MKVTHIVMLIVIAVGIGIVISTSGDASSYATFKEAKARAEAGNTEAIHVAGKLPKNASGEIKGMVYRPTKAPNTFHFLMKDRNGALHQVVYRNPKPQDFERSEQVVVVGKFKGETFVADKILMKCPSKYKEKGDQFIEAS